MSVYKLVCPHCHGKLRIRTSDGVHPLLRVAYLQCTYEVCSWGCRAQFEMTHELSPSGMPDPRIRLPRATAAIRLQAQAHARPAARRAATPKPQMDLTGLEPSP